MAHRDAPALAITGGASGFGMAVAGCCAERGMDVALLDLDRERADDAARAIEADHGTRALGIGADVASADELDAAAATVRDQLGRCDLLWVNVAVQHFAAVEAVTDDELHWVLDVNVVGAVRTVRSFLPLLRESSAPRLAFTASANALAPAERLGAYQVSKYAVVGLAETLRMELSHESIPVSIVYPSGMLTRHLESSAAARPPALGEGGDFSGDLEAMMASRPMTEADFATAEDAAVVAVAGVLAGEPHVITHGALAEPVRTQQMAIRRALDLAGEREAPDA